MAAPFTHSTMKLKRVKKLQFGVLGPDEIRQMSVTQKVTVNKKVIPAGITRYETYSNGLPLYGGVNDPRMGTFDQRAKCKTCDCTYTGGGGGNKINDCPGHFGHIELARPVFHVGFLEVALKMLRCVCFHCGRLRLGDNEFKYRLAKQIADPKKRLAFLHDVCRSKARCTFGTDDLANGAAQVIPELPEQNGESSGNSGCGGLQPTFTKTGLRVDVEYPAEMEAEDIPGGGDRKQTLSAYKVHEIFKLISEDDMKMLGLDPVYSRPDWLIITVLPVPPPHVRPSVALDGMNRSEDDLTHQLVNIVKANNTLENCVRTGEPQVIVDSFEQLLQYKIAALFDNERAGQPQETQRSGKPLKTIRQRLKGKEGRIRGNLMGKRVDFSARTVITADPNLGIDQVGVPRSIALNLTVPEMVTPYNQEFLAQLVARGPLEHPGAKFIVRQDGVRVDLRYVRNKTDLILEFGWVVERHLTDDDVIVFNRQPSLHKMSIMGHRVKVLDFSTFRLNLSVTSPYNADFDGDEMNLHVPQSVTAKAEVQELMMVPRNIVSPQSNKPVMGIVQDSLMAVAKMTRRDAFVPRDLMMNIMMWVEDWDGYLPAPAIYKPEPLWTGKQVFSMVCPKVNFETTANGHPKGANTLNASDTAVLIQEGELLMGIVDKKTVGSSPQGLIHISWLERGWDVTRIFMGAIQKVVNHWLLTHSFSIGVADTVADADTVRTIEGIIESAKAQVGSLVESGQKGDLKTQPGKSMMESLEANINTVLNKCRDDSGTSAQQSLDQRNAVKHMATCGSKGSFINISQILACVGQQNVEGARIPYGFRRRTLPHFCKDDLGPESRGFVENSYLRGLRPQEFFFHAMGGREGLIDTAVKTAETGYIQRRLVKALEAVSAKYDGTLRDQNNKVVQFLYGEDGMDGVWVERQALNILTMSRGTMLNNYHLDVNSETFGDDPRRPGTKFLTPEKIAACRGDDALRTKLEAELDQLRADQKTLVQIFAARGQGEAASTTSNLPVNIRRLIWNAQKTHRINSSEPTDLDPGYVVDRVRELCSKLMVVGGKDRLSIEAQHNATILFHILVRSELAAKPVLQKHRLDKAAFNLVVGEVESKFMASKVAAGEMCGVLAAQSIGEPITQMTLNTFHYAGVSAKNVTLGVPRVKEIINVASHVRTPSLTIYLADGQRQDQDTAKKVVDLLEYVTMRDITLSTEIFYDPDIHNTVIEADAEFVNEGDMDDDMGMGLDGGTANHNQLSPWVLRFVLREALVVDKGIRLREDVAMSIQAVWGHDVHVQYSEQNADPKVIRVRTFDESNADKLSADGDLLRTDEVQFLKRFEKNLLDMRLLGIQRITKVYMTEGTRPEFTEETGFVSKKEWHLETDGSDFRTVLSYEIIDHHRTLTNDVVECLQVLGIEGARSSLLREFRAVVEKDGSYVNYRHLGTLVDVMTFRGFLMAITRHGINRVDNGPMLRSSFEETVEILMEAAVFAEADNLRGVTDNIMLGQLANLGTGCMDLLLDDKRLSQAIEYAALDQQMARVGGAAAAAIAGPTPAHTPRYTPGYMGGASPASGIMTPFSGSFSPMASPFSGAFSPGGVGGRSPSSPAYGSSSSPAYSPQSSGYSPASPAFSPTSPVFSPTSPAFSPTSPAFSPTSPAFSPTSPAFSPTSPAFSPTSPAYSPTSPAGPGAYSPSSPMYSPSSPMYSPTSPARGGGGLGAGTKRAGSASPAYSPTSPAYSPTSPAYSGGTATGGSRSPAYSPTSPAYSPTSPAYSPSSPAYSPKSPGAPKPAYGSSASPMYSPSTPGYSISPGYSSSNRSPGSAGTPTMDISPSYSPPGMPNGSSSKPPRR